MDDALYREIQRKMEDGRDSFSVLIADGDGYALGELRTMVLDDGFSWTLDPDRPIKSAGPGRSRVSFVRQRRY